MAHDEIKHQFDSLAWLESQGLIERKILLLDLNFWIQMAKSETELQRELKDRIAELVSSRRLVCPVSPSLLMELGKQPPSPSRDIQSGFMDDFSCGMSVKIGPRIFPMEYEAAANGETLPREVVFSHFFDAMNEQPFAFESPSVLPEEIARAAADILFENQAQMSITHFMNTRFSRGIDPAVSRMSTNFREMAKLHQNWSKNHTMPRQQIENGELLSLLLSSFPEISPVIQSTNTMTRSLEILDNCPTFWCIYKAFSALRWGGTVRENDFFDVLNLAPAIPYVDCAAGDRGTRHILKNLLDTEQRFNNRIVASESELLQWLTEEFQD